MAARDGGPARWAAPVLLSALALGAPIVNGDKTDDYPSVVSLGLDAGAYSFSACTANLISPRVLVTAAHCGAEIGEELVAEFGVAFFGSDIWEPDQVIGFEQMILHPDYSPLVGNTLPEFDLAVIVLEEAPGVEPTWFRRDALTEADIDDTLVSVGFGSTGSSGAGSGYKRFVELPLSDYDEQFALSKSSDTGGQICSGDSGGPQFQVVDGHLVQIAIHSWGDTGCSRKSGSTRTDIAAAWILDQVAEAEGTGDLCHANGWYDDGVCDGFCDRFDLDCTATGDLLPAESGFAGCSSGGASGLALWGLVALFARRRSRD